ncbi:ATP-dependent DNA ligase [Aquabacterium sp. OR-4]|uniref:ATP-dependent DNA ligase n=1 Tax=Aquabacterium sp. OR-4 TaxID=2978127 RepID=UPI0028C89245|nr:ATP-dependent DNA ligase [Aquabacterium sp. OR-4]MDT7835829.1 ATP-dependent DNA ligase [Aquabacterium sp. OR-4]
MRRFAALYAALDASTSTEAKVAAMVAYLAEAPAADAAWAVFFLAGGRPRQTVPTALLRSEARAAAGIPEWLFEASYQAVGDLAETIAHLLPPPGHASALGLADWLTQRLLPLRGAAPEAQAAQLRAWWHELTPAERFVLIKLIGGGFRVGVSKLLVQRALARHAGLPAALVAQRMMGYADARAQPDADALLALLAAADAPGQRDLGQPYPFYLAHALEPAADTPEALTTRLGAAAQWLAEWKYDGIRAQLVRRGSGPAAGVWLWSRGEELMAGRFPEVEQAAATLPAGTVLDGELLVWPAGDARPAPFQRLQTRIQRKTLTRRLLADTPVVFVAYDQLEADGTDLRGWPQHQRRARLEAELAAWHARAADGASAAAVHTAVLRLSPLLPVAPAGGDGHPLPDTWATWAAQRAGSRERGVEGLMLKHRDAPYGSGRTKAAGLVAGGWWKWKVAPFTVDGVLIYAQAGHGRRAGLYTDYTFAVWNRPPRDAAEAAAVVEAIARREPAEPGALQLVPFTKAYSGLSDAEFAAVDRVIRAHTLEKFGPVRSVRPSLVLELGFEGLQRSPRHKSGIALRFPRMLRLRPDKPLHEADALPALLALLEPGGTPSPGCG